MLDYEKLMITKGSLIDYIDRNIFMLVALAFFCLLGLASIGALVEKYRTEIEIAKYDVKCFLNCHCPFSVTGIIMCLVIGTLFWIQSSYEIVLFQWDSENGIDGPIGLTIAILTMYGIFLGVLQYVSSYKENIKCFGRNKISFFMERNKAYRFSQRKSFVFLCFTLIMAPCLGQIFPKEYRIYFICAWQTSFMIILISFVLVLSLSLKLIDRIRRINSNEDNWIIQSIRMQMELDYWILSRKLCKSYFSYEMIDRFLNQYEYECKQMESNDEIQLFTKIVFRGVETPLNMLNEKLNDKYKCFRKGRNPKEVIERYEDFIERKWGIIKANKDALDVSAWTTLILQDIWSLHVLISKQVEPEGEHSQGTANTTRNIDKFLIDCLLDKLSVETCEHIIKEVMELCREIDYKREFMHEDMRNLDLYSWKTLLSCCVENSLEFIPPQFKSQMFGNDTANERQHEIYSKSCFNVLCSQYYHHRDRISDDHQVCMLINSMNSKYRMAYSMYQFFYPRESWGQNDVFFSELIRKELNYCDEDSALERYYSAAEIVSKTHIGHRITKSLLLDVLKTKNKVIDSFTPFREVDKIKLLYFQEILADVDIHTRYFRDFSRVEIKAGKELTRELKDVLTEYFIVLCEFPKLRNAISIKMTIMDIIPLSIRHFNEIVRNYTYKSLLLLERAYRECNGIDDREITSLFSGLIQYETEFHKLYIFDEEKFHFFSVKLLDSNYDIIWNDEEMKNAYKNFANEYFSRKNIGIEEYIGDLHCSLINFPELNFNQLNKSKLKELIKDIVIMQSW